MVTETLSRWPTQVHSSAPVLRSMLEAGGDPNTRDGFNQPMILMNWYLGYYKDQARSRFDLLLDHGADVNSTMPADRSDSAGYSLLLYRTAMGLDDNLAYADALLLLHVALIRIVPGLTE